MSKGAGSGRGADQNQRRPGNRQADIRGAETEDMIKDKAGRATGRLAVEDGRGLKQAGQNTREIQAGSGRGQAGSAMSDQAGKRWQEHIYCADEARVAGMLSEGGPMEL